MKEIEAIRKQILIFFNSGDAAALDRLYLVLNKVVAELSVKRALLGLPEPMPEPEPEGRLEMVNQERLDREGFE
jgi:hypothetical protein